MIQHGSLDWSYYTLDQCIQAANMIKFNLATAKKWTDVKATAAQAGKQGALRPQSGTLPNTSTTTDLPSYCMKETLSPREVEKLMKRYNCFVCCRQNRAFNKCGIVKCFYKVTPVSDSLPVSNTTTQRTPSNNTNRPTQQHQSRGTTSANLASLPITVTNVPVQYDGFADITQPNNPPPTNDTTEYDSPVDTDNTVANNTTNTTVSNYSYSICRCSAKRVKFSAHINPSHFF